MTVKSADRTILILEAIAGKKEGITHGQLSHTLCIPKSSLTSLLANLQSRNYLSFDSISKRYMLGPQILSLAGRYLSGLDIVSLGQSIVNDLMAATDESTGLTVRKGLEVLTVYMKNCPHPIMRTLQIGDRAPIYATATGRAILAYLPDEEIHKYLKSVDLKPITQATITEANQLWRLVNEVRANGIAYCREEFHEGSTAMAAPVFNISGNVTASIHVVVPSIRFTEKKELVIADALRKAAKKLSHRLGFNSEVNNRSHDESAIEV